jgi:hypothetical protein
VAANPPTWVITTDASPWGWAASLHQISTPSTFSLHSTVSLFRPINTFVQDRWPLEGSLSHINVLEAKAILLELKTDPPFLKNQVISIRERTLLWLSQVVRRMASHLNPALNTIGAAMARFCARHKITISDLTYIPSEWNPMDVHSRQWSLDRIAMEWPLRIDTFRFLLHCFGVHPVVDAFATASNNKLPRFWSRFLDPHAEAVNAFDRSWNPTAVGGWLYLNPPFSLLPRVIAKIIQDREKALFVVPSRDGPAPPRRQGRRRSRAG